MKEQSRLELLEILQADARTPAERIAAMLGEPVEAVEQAIKELEEQKIILRYHTLIDWERAGVDYVSARIDVKVTPQREVGFDRIAERLSRFPEVHSCTLVSGDHDLSVEIRAANLKAVANFVSEKLSTLEGVASTTTHFVLKRYKHDGILYGGEAGSDERLAVAP